MALASLSKLREMQSELVSLGQDEAAQRLGLVVVHYAKLQAVLDLQEMPELEQQLESELESHAAKTCQELAAMRTCQAPKPEPAASLQALRAEIEAKLEEDSRSLASELEEIKQQVRSLAEAQEQSTGLSETEAEAAARMAAWRAEIDESVRALGASLERDRKALADLVQEAKTLGSRVEALEVAQREAPPRKRGFFTRREPSERL